MALKAELRKIVKKGFETHPEGITIGEMCEIVERAEILKDGNGYYKVLRAMVDLGMVMAPYQKYYQGRCQGGCPYPFEVSYTLPNLLDACLKIGIKEAIKERLKRNGALSVRKLKKDLPFNLSGEKDERLFNESLKELETDRVIESLNTLPGIEPTIRLMEPEPKTNAT